MCRLLMLLLCLAAPSAEGRAQGEFTELRAADYPITAEGLPYYSASHAVGRA